jgi:hypothetical protein
MASNAAPGCRLRASTATTDTMRLHTKPVDELGNIVKKCVSTPFRALAEVMYRKSIREAAEVVETTGAWSSRAEKLPIPQF